MHNLYKHLKTISNGYIPNNLSYTDYLIDVICFSILVFIILNNNFYHKIENEDFVDLFNITDSRFYSSILVICVFIVMGQFKKLMPAKDIALFRAVGLSTKEIFLMLLLRSLPFCLAVFLSAPLHPAPYTVSLIAAIIFLFVIYIPVIINCRAFNYSSFALNFPNKTTAFAFGETCSNISLFSAVLQIVFHVVVSFMLGKVSCPPELFFIIVTFLLYATTADCFFKRENNIVLYKAINLKKADHCRYIVTFAGTLILLYLIVYIIGYSLAGNSLTKSLGIIFTCFAYVIIFFGGFSTLKVSTYSNKNSIGIVLAYLLLGLIPIVPIIVLLKGLVECKRNPYYYERP